MNGIEATVQVEEWGDLDRCRKGAGSHIHTQEDGVEMCNDVRSVKRHVRQRDHLRGLVFTLGRRSRSRLFRAGGCAAEEVQALRWAPQE